MKKMQFNSVNAIIIGLALIASCTKEKQPLNGSGGSGGNGQQNDTSHQQQQYPNTDKSVYAGFDIIIELPTTECTLSGHGRNVLNDNASFTWTKISGPAAATLDNNHANNTRVKGLERGVYQFELKATNNAGFSDADTVMVTVGQLPEQPEDTILSQQTWIYPWYNDIEVNNFYTLIPPGTFFKVFIRRYDATEWIEVKPLPPGGESPENVKYDYFIEGRPDGVGMYTFNSLYINYYGSDTNDKPDVKILY